MQAWPGIVATMPVAPTIARGPLPRKSPPIWKFVNPRKHHQVIGMCFPAGTPVRMADGSERPIEAVEIGDRVVTHLHGSRSVLNTFRRMFTGDLVSVRVSGHPGTIQATAEHPFAVWDGSRLVWKRADSLTPEDRVILGAVAPADGVDSIDVLDHVGDAHGVDDQSAYLRPEVARASAEQATREFAEPDRERVRLFKMAYRNSVFRYISITPSLSRLIGLYLAEGTTDYSGRRISWALDVNEIHLARDVEQLMRGCFGVDVEHIEGLTGRNVRYVRINNLLLYRLFCALVPGKADTKRVPGFLMAAPESVRRAVLVGWWDGDGHQSIRGKRVIMQGVTISPGLARDMATLCASLGVRAAVQARKARDDRRQAFDVYLSGREAVALQPSFAARVESVGLLKRRYREDGFCPFGRVLPVRSVSRLAVVDLPVFDFEVEEDHSFLAAGIVVHNCVGRSAARMAETLLRIPPGATEATAPKPAVDISSLYAYWIAREESRRRGIRLSGDGAIVSHSIAADAARGYVGPDLWPDDEPQERAYADAIGLDEDEIRFGAAHRLTNYAIIDTFEKQLEYLAQGYPLQTGMPVTKGWLQTDDAGRFHDRGDEIGGHATCTIGYDMDEGWVAILNSWSRWGRRSTDPAFRHTDGYTNIGYMMLEQYRAKFNERDVQSGRVEAVVANHIGGFEDTGPLIAVNWENLYGSGMPA
jgi:hypothetical protein